MTTIVRTPPIPARLAITVPREARGRRQCAWVWGAWPRHSTFVRDWRARSHSQSIREAIMKYSANGTFIEKAALTGKRLLIEAAGGSIVDFGKLSETSKGPLDLDPSLVVWFVDADGRPMSATNGNGQLRTLRDPDVAGFDLFHGFAGWGGLRSSISHDTNVRAWCMEGHLRTSLY